MTAVNLCHMPQPMAAPEAEIYHKLREIHCGQQGASHDCIGVVSLDRAGITMRCKRCGDARQTYPQDGSP